jgi:hypothetical protein
VEKLRMPFFIVAVILAVVIVLVEVSSIAWIDGLSANNATPTGKELATPGLGIAYLALVDGILLFTIGIWALAAWNIIDATALGKVVGVSSFIVMLLLLLACIGLILLAFVFLTMMVTLLFSPPFGTIAYLAAFSDFDVRGARITLALIMSLKIALVVCLLLAQQTFFANKTFLLLLGTALLANVIVSFLHDFLPRFLASILDAVAAIVVAILAAIWALIKLIGSISPVLKALIGLVKDLLRIRPLPQE